MRHRTRRKRSRLKLRPYGVITIKTGENQKDQSVVISNSVPTGNRKSGSRKSGSRKSGSLGSGSLRSGKETVRWRKKAIVALLKTSSTLALLTLILHWSATEPQDNALQNNTEQASSPTSNSVGVISQGSDSIENKTLDTDVSLPTAPVEESIAVPVEEIVETTETEFSQDSAAQDAAAFEGSSASVIVDNVIVDDTVADTEQQNTQDIIAPATVAAPATEDQPGTPEPTILENLQNIPTQTFIRTYKASVFIDLSENSTETPIRHGTVVNILERTGDWVKIEAPDNGIKGFIHVTHLNIR